MKKSFVSIRKSCSQILGQVPFNPQVSGREGELTIVELPECVIEPVFEPSRADSLAVVFGVGLTTEFVIQRRQRFLSNCGHNGSQRG